MPEPSSKTTHTAPPPSRLDGWKAIAVYLGRGVRTAQRWEKEIGLPVRRQGTGTAEAVFAIPAEIDAWRDAQTRQPTTVTMSSSSSAPAGEIPSAGYPTAPNRLGRHWLPWIVAAVGVTVAIALLVPRWLTQQTGSGAARRSSLADAAQRKNPASLVAAGSAIVAIDVNGEKLWSYTLNAPLAEAADPLVWSAVSRVVDVDGDGANEVLFARHVYADPGAYAFTSAGGLLFRHLVDRTVRFGDSVFGPLWEPDKLFPLPDTHTLAVTFHVADEFASVIRELDIHQRVIGEYWSNGYVTSFSRATAGGSTLTFVGGIFNETNGASLAAFRGPIRGSAPAATPKYRCQDCPAGSPGPFLVFPRTRLQDELAQLASLQGVSALGPDTFSVRVNVADAGGGDVAYAYYQIDSRGRVVGAAMGSEFEGVQRRLEQTGRVTAATRSRGTQDLFPVLRWNGKSFDRVNGVEAR